jgi:hypothetical protein
MKAPSIGGSEALNGGWPLKTAPLGSPLKLRASVDLTKAGQAEIKITPHNLEKFEPKK